MVSKFHLQAIAINHVCLIVRDRPASEAFYMGVLGLARHHRINSWYVLNQTSTLHLVQIPEAADEGSVRHELQHFALQISDLSAIRDHLLDCGLKPFQMDFEGQTCQIRDRSDPLTFGLGTVFVYDPDGNLVEFLQEGRGVFTPDMAPQPSW